LKIAVALEEQIFVSMGQITEYRSQLKDHRSQIKGTFAVCGAFLPCDVIVLDVIVIIVMRVLPLMLDFRHNIEIVIEKEHNEKYRCDIIYTRGGKSWG
jgi:hypothetical protein